MTHFVIPEGVRRILTEGFARALKAVDLESRVHDALPVRPLRRTRVSIIAIGKAAPAMAAGAIKRWPDFIDRALVVAPDGTPCSIREGEVEVLRASHPLPDARSVEAGTRALAVAKQARGLLLVLISGGASSLVCAPIEGVTLENKREIVRALLVSGASIAQINSVRRHLSRIKGGGLGRAAAPTHVFTLLASDVIGAEYYDVGSGPTVPDPTTVEDARSALLMHARKFRGVPLKETLKPGEPEASLQRARLVASPADLARAMSLELGAEGFSPQVIPASHSSVEQLADEYRALAATLAPGTAILRAAEPIVHVSTPTPGRGGRSGHLAAMLAHALPEGVVFMAVASDGIDGDSGSSGAIVDAGSWANIDKARAERAISSYDTAPLHAEAKTALLAGPTGVNLADLHVLLRRAD